MAASPKLPFSDPGGEVASAPVGSVQWAQRIRLEMQGAVKDLARAPKAFEGYHEICVKHRAWTLMNRRDGSFFATFEEFCACEQPWGLGRPFAEIEPFLVALHGKPALQLITAAPSQQGRRPDATSTTELAKSGNHETPRLLRAILRAPQPIQQLYRDGLIGQKEAAALGPDRPTPEQAAVIAEVTATVRGTQKPAEPKETVRTQRSVNSKVREMLGRKELPLSKFERLGWASPIEDLAAAITLLTGIHAERCDGAKKPRRGKR